MKNTRSSSGDGAGDHPAALPTAKGFTLIELAVVMAIMVGLAGVATVVFTRMDDARITKAQMDCKVISDALGEYIKDTRLRPTSSTGAAGWYVLEGDLGTAPENQFITSGERATRVAGVGAITRTNTWNNPRWRGPYMQQTPADPWGRRYVAWVRSYHATGRRVWILSAGPNGRVETNFDSASLQGDDAGCATE